MSLKAKLEAVVYAAEEPVTLALLATMFAEEVLPMLAEAPVSAAEPQAEQIELPTGEAPVASSEEPQEAQSAEVDEKKQARLRDRQVRQVLQVVLDELIKDYASSDRGMEIREIAGGYRMATKPEYHDAVRGFVKSLKPPMKLSLQALETLAVIAYKQPVTAPEVSEIRGVDSGGVLGGLVSRKLITTAGRKQVIGRPILYKTTKEFLLRFGLKDVNDLPSMEEFEKMAGELAEVEAAGDAQDAALQATEASPQNTELHIDADPSFSVDESPVSAVPEQDAGDGEHSTIAPETTTQEPAIDHPGTPTLEGEP